MEWWTQDGNLLEGAEMLAVYPSIEPENQSFMEEKGKNGQPPWRRGDASYPSIKPENQSFIKENMVAGWKPPRRGEEMLAIHQSKRKSIIHQGKMKKLSQDEKDKWWIPPRRGRDASCPSIKTEINRSSRNKGIVVARWKPPRRGRDAEMLAVHPYTIKPENQSFTKEKWKNGRRMEIP